jgi:exopolysaccharide biosynthesis protein
MTYGELATYMSELGCDEALNFDGGGSSTLWVLGQVMNSPSEGDERGVANGVVLLQKTKAEHSSASIPK